MTSGRDAREKMDRGTRVLLSPLRMLTCSALPCPCCDADVQSHPAEDGFMLSVRRRAGSHEFYSSGELYQLLLGLCLLLRDLLRPLIIHDVRITGSRSL